MFNKGGDNMAVHLIYKTKYLSQKSQTDQLIHVRKYKNTH